MSKCVGCGVKIQTTDQNKEGYLPEIVLLENGENVYCKRCHDIIHHNKEYVYNTNTDNYYNKIKFIKDTNSLIILMLDVLNLNSSFIPNLKEYIGDNKVLILINKIDIMPKTVKLNKLEMLVKEMALSNNLNVVSVMQISSKSKHNIENVIEKIKKLRFPKPKPTYAKNQRFVKINNKKLIKPNFDDVYVMGCASVGKSTFINSLLEITKLNHIQKITTSKEFNTTLDFIKIPLDNKNFIIDTPGIINPNTFGHILNYESIKLITPSKYIKPKTYQLKENQTIFIGGLVQLDFISGDKINISTYISNDLYVHRTKLENSENIFTTQLTKLLTPPTNEDELKIVTNRVVHSFTILNGAYDLEIPTVGFIHIVGENIKFNVLINEKIKIKLSRSFI